MPSRAENRERTHAELSAAARSLFLRDGFDATTADEIAEAAGVSRRTFFRYFPTKEEVVFADHAVRVAAFEAGLKDAGEACSAFERVRHACLAMADRFQAERAWVVTQDRLVNTSPQLVARELELDREYEALMAREFARDRGSDARRARIVAGACMGAVRAALREWFDNDGRENLRALAVATFALLAPLGAAAPPARKGRPG